MLRKETDVRKKMALVLFVPGLLTTVSFCLLLIYKPSFFIHLDYKVYDTLLQTAHSPETTSTPIIVDIDERSLRQFGQWPWPRYRVAQLLENIRKLGASSIALDMVFAERDRTSLCNIKEEIRRDLNVDIDFTEIASPIFDYDRTLADTLSRGPFILGYRLSFDSGLCQSGDNPEHSMDVALLTDFGTPLYSPPLIRAEGAVGNLKELSLAARCSGFFTSSPDDDAIIRRVPLLMAYEDKIYPSLALASLVYVLGPKRVFLRTQSTGEQFLYLDALRIPLDGKGRMLIHYRGPRNRFPYVSAADILNGQTDGEALRNKMVFVGSSATGLEELRATPFDPTFPGVEVHATIVDNILKGDFLARPAWAPGLELLLILALGIGSTVFLIWTPARWCLVFTAALALAVWGGAEAAFRIRGIFISPLFPIMVLGANFSILNLFKYWLEEQEVRSREKEICMVQELTIQCLASLAETRDPETGGHILRTQQYVKALCNYLASHPNFRKHLTPDAVEMIYKAAPLHDIGKVGIEDGILFKSGKLTDEEFEQMKRHTIYGRDAIAKAQERLRAYDGGSLFLDFAKELIHTHHEKWNGTGYPQGLKGEDIPVSGRVMALADVYDALISKRVYKRAFSHEEAVRIIVEGKGTQFDPDVVGAFVEIESIFRQIATELSDD